MKHAGATHGDCSRLVFAVMLVLSVAALLTGCGRGAIIEWVNLVRFNGITYSSALASQPLAAQYVEAEYATVKFRLDGNVDDPNRTWPMTTPSPTTPSETKPAQTGDRRLLYGVGAGLLPVTLMCLFGFTQCPPQDYTCYDVNQGPGGWFFVLAVGIYCAKVLAMLIGFFFRRLRPIAVGLLLMLLVGPILGVYGYLAITMARHPRSNDTGPQRPALVATWRAPVG